MVFSITTMTMTGADVCSNGSNPLLIMGNFVNTSTSTGLPGAGNVIYSIVGSITVGTGDALAA